MSAPINYTQEDRDRSIRTEAEVKHIDKSVNGLKIETKDLVELTRNQAFTIAGILESMKDAKAFMHEVGQHNQRLHDLEKRAALVEDTLEKRTLILEQAETRLQVIEQKIDRVSFLGKVMWAVVTTPAVLAVVILGLQLFQTR